MKIALFSDIHANIDALKPVLNDIEQRKPDAVYCLGDLVGYAPYPNEVVEMIRSKGIPVIAGNYDQGVGLYSDDCGCAYKTPEDEVRGVDSITYTNRIISSENRAYLRSLPAHFRLEFDVNGSPWNFLMVHGSPSKINEYLNIPSKIKMGRLTNFASLSCSCFRFHGTIEFDFCQLQPFLFHFRQIYPLYNTRQTHLAPWDGSFFSLSG
jgi:predicted phosphodiesterase